MRFFTTDRKLTPSVRLLWPSSALLRKFFWPVVYLSFIPGLLLTVALYILGDKPSELPASQVQTGGLILLIGLVWLALAQPAGIYMMTQAIRGKEPTTSESFQKGLPMLLPLVALNFLTFLTMVIGFILLVVPGFIALRALLLAPYYLVDKKLGPIQAMKMSYHETNPVSAYIYGLLGVIFFLVFLGAIFTDVPVVGPILSLLIPYPYLFALALRYGEISRTGKVLHKLLQPAEAK